MPAKRALLAVQQCLCTCSNVDQGRYIMFLPRTEEVFKGRMHEAYKIDLHIPSGMRKEKKIMSAVDAADAARLYLTVMQRLRSKPYFVCGCC